MKQCMDVDAIQKRLKRIEGQVRGIQKMVDEDKPCESILIQIVKIGTYFFVFLSRLVWMIAGLKGLKVCLFPRGSFCI